MNQPNAPFFVFDVESIGLHGEGFAVGGGAYVNGVAQWEFRLSCPTDECAGSGEDLQWVKDNIPAIEETHRSSRVMRDEFWKHWMVAFGSGAKMAVECGWPVEANFLRACIADDPTRKWNGPYPLHEIASYLSAAGMDPMAKYDRTPMELPVHDPLADARQSARLLSEALAIIGNIQTTKDA